MVLKSVGLLTAILFFVSCEGDLNNLVQNVELEERYPDSYSTNFNITYSDSAKLKVNISGKSLEQYTRKDELQAYDIMRDSVVIKFYNANGEVSSEMKSDYAIRYHGTELMNAKGNVEVINKKGERLNTERLTWDKRIKQINCDTAVVITKPSGQIIEGSSLTSDQNFDNYKITKVKGILPFEREEAPK
jgi:LPS export ABC transporter protein LptC